jgi:hypothetical protein
MLGGDFLKKLLIVFVAFLVITGCSKNFEDSLSISKETTLEYYPKNEKVNFYVLLESHDNKVKPFLIKFQINDEKLSSALGKNEVVINTSDTKHFEKRGIGKKVSLKNSISEEDMRTAVNNGSIKIHILSKENKKSVIKGTVNNFAIK